MREILFRGKRIDNGEWEYGGYFKHNNRQKCVIGDYDKPEDFDDLIIFSGFADWNMPRPLNCVKVDPTTIGQYTGLIDKNGKMIFEGDILEAHFDEYSPENATVVKVIWHENGFGTKQGDFCPDPLCADDCEAWEVIGNIYDNPELLEDVHQ